MPEKSRRHHQIRSFKRGVRSSVIRGHHKNLLSDDPMLQPSASSSSVSPMPQPTGQRSLLPFRVFEILSMCPVCGYGIKDPPRDYNICPCCGIEFGYDDSETTYAALRQLWVLGGAKWWSPNTMPPQGWSADKQMSSSFGVWVIEGLNARWETAAFDLQTNSAWTKLARNNLVLNQGLSYGSG